MKKFVLIFLVLSIPCWGQEIAAAVPQNNEIQFYNLLGPVKSVKRTEKKESTKKERNSIIYTNRKFNAAGFLTYQKNSYSDSDNNTVLLYTYDKQNRIIFQSFRNNYSSNKQVYKYLKNGSVETTNFYTADENAKISLFEKKDSEGFLIEQKRYDSSGNLIAKFETIISDSNSENIYTSYYQNKVSSIQTARYSNDGNIIFQQSKNAGTGKLLWKWNYEYKNNRIIRAAFRDYKNSYKNKIWIYKYNKDGSLASLEIRINKEKVEIRKFYYDKKILNRETVEYFYNISKNDKEFDFVVFAVWEHNYNAKGQVISSIYRNLRNDFNFYQELAYSNEKISDNTLTNNFDFVLNETHTDYDSKQRIIENITSGISEKIEKYEYNNEGRTLSYAVYTLDGTYLSGTKKEYDKYGNLIKQTEYGVDNQIHTIREYIYTYDKNGNWIKQIYYNTNNIKEFYKDQISITEREIIYY